jgi:hypothetical protein
MLLLLLLLLLGSLLPVATVATITKPQNGQGTNQRVGTLLVLHMLLLLLLLQSCCVMHSCSGVLHPTPGWLRVSAGQLWPKQRQLRL